MVSENPQDVEVESARRLPRGTNAAVGVGETGGALAVGWDNEDDPENPQNWSTWKKTINVGIVCILSFITYVVTFLNSQE